MSEKLNFRWLALVLLLCAAIMVPMAVKHAVDFPVYYATGHAFLSGTGPIYGPKSGLGYPMHYRYPPLFLLVFVPFALLPFNVSVTLWAALKWLVLFLLIRAMAQRMHFPSKGWWWLIPASLSASFLVQELKGGNVQFFIFALVAAALLAFRKTPWLGVLLLAFATSLKVWPFFFVPYLAARRRYREAAATVALTVVLTLLPAAYFGWQGNVQLLRQWATQEWGPSSLSVDMWYPSQSLSGVLQRYFTVIDYSKAADPNYRTIDVVSIPPLLVRGLWAALVVLSCGGLFLLAQARPASDGWIEDSLAWCGVVMLEPFTHRISLLALLWPGMVAGMLLARPGVLPVWSRRLFYAAAAIVAIEPLIPGRATQRLFQVLGVDFWATLLVTAALVIAWLQSDPFSVAAEDRDPASPTLSPIVSGP